MEPVQNTYWLSNFTQGKYQSAIKDRNLYFAPKQLTRTLRRYNSSTETCCLGSVQKIIHQLKISPDFCLEHALIYIRKTISVLVLHTITELRKRYWLCRNTCFFTFEGLQKICM